ncbi:hypothetical protein [Streptodolium elevatio]|uniref:Uncharacterized protein n=1 Tax=Streptodolium elevatio TaxID=3157996 RepID=A0ABV3DGQ8_9ACTN
MDGDADLVLGAAAAVVEDGPRRRDQVVVGVIGSGADHATGRGEERLAHPPQDVAVQRHQRGDLHAPRRHHLLRVSVRVAPSGVAADLHARAVVGAESGGGQGPAHLGGRKQV